MRDPLVHLSVREAPPYPEDRRFAGAPRRRDVGVASEVGTASTFTPTLPFGRRVAAP